MVHILDPILRHDQLYIHKYSVENPTILNNELYIISNQYETHCIYKILTFAQLIIMNNDEGCRLFIKFSYRNS